MTINDLFASRLRQKKAIVDFQIRPKRVVERTNERTQKTFENVSLLLLTVEESKDDDDDEEKISVAEFFSFITFQFDFDRKIHCFRLLFHLFRIVRCYQKIIEEKNLLFPRRI